MTNRFRTALYSRLVAPLDAVYSRLDDGQLDGTRPPVQAASTATAPLTGSQRVHLRHITH